MDLLRRMQSNTVGSDSSLDYLRPISNCSFSVVRCGSEVLQLGHLFWLLFAVNYVAFPHHC